MTTKEYGKFVLTSVSFIFCILLLSVSFVSINRTSTPAYATTSEMRTAMFTTSPTDDMFKIINTRLNDQDVVMSFRTAIVNQYTSQERLLLAQSFDTIKEAITNAKSNPKPIGYIGYDNEADNANLSTPPDELINPGSSTNVVADMVHKAGYKFAITPTRTILLQEYQQVDWTKVDMLVMQLQQVMTNQQTITSIVTQIATYVKAHNPNTVIFVQVNPALDTVAHITDNIKGISGLIDGMSIVCSTECTPDILDHLLTPINLVKTESDTNTATYPTQSDLADINNVGIGGVGSSSIVSPPSFGDGNNFFSDGLTLTLGKNTTTFDISQYNQEIPKQVMVDGQKVNMTFKTFEGYSPTGVIHMGLYIIPRNQDMLTSNSIASIEYDKNSPVQINDPNQILTNASVSSTSDGTFQYIQFSFVPTKSYDEMSFLGRAWNDHRYATDVRVQDAIIQPQSKFHKILPPGVVLYDNFTDLQAALEKDRFYKHEIMSHIHSAFDVFGSSEGGHVYWLYDTTNHTVTLVIADNNDNELSSTKESLEPYIVEQKGDYKFMKFTVDQLNRWDEKQEKNAKEVEATKALSMALKKGLSGHSNW